MIQHINTPDFETIQHDPKALEELKGALEEIRHLRNLDAHNIPLRLPADAVKMEVGKVAIIIENMALDCNIQSETPMIPIDRTMVEWALGKLEELAQPKLKLSHLRSAAGVGNNTTTIRLPHSANQTLEQIVKKQPGFTGLDEGMIAG